MIIQSIQLNNFRCFKDIKIDFDDRLTVLVGVNGAGKTAVLDALAIYLKWAGQMATGNAAEPIMKITDITINSKPDEVIHKIWLKMKNKSKKEKMYNFHSLCAGVLDNTDEIKMAVTHVGDFIQMLKATKPVFSAYMAGRYISESDFILPQKANKTSSYWNVEKSFSRSIDFNSTLVWLDKADTIEARAMRDDGKKDELPELVAVREAILKALLGDYERPTIRGIPPEPSELVIYQKGTNQQFKLSQLSDGYRAMLALVMDLARRMAQSHENENNISKESILNTPAVVLIDEVEMHLHPSWQQTVLTTLMSIFPNTQFIVTTHSPQVLSAIPNKHIRILNEGKIYTHDGQTEGAEASQLLEHIFRVKKRPGNLKIVKALNEYRDLVYDEQWNTPRAEDLKKMLDEHFGSDDIELMELNLHIENSKWESGL